MTLPRQMARALDDYLKSGRSRRDVLRATLAAGGLAAALSTADGLLLAIANALSHDIYYKMVDTHASTGRRLTVARMLLILVAAIAAYTAIHAPAGILIFVSWAFSLAAAGLFPALVMGVWWKRTTSAGAVLGMLGGFGVCGFYIYMTQYAGMTPWFGIANISAGVFGMPVAFIVTWVVSRMTPEPSEEMQRFVEAIRIPSGEMLMPQDVKAATT